MTAISTAIGIDRRARVSGYKIGKYQSNETENLPHVIAIFAEANTANQSGLTTDKFEVTSASEAGEIYGYGSPIHRILRILRPNGSDGVGGIPTIVFPQLTDAGATATVISFTVTGTATANATHALIINGRENLDFQSSSYSVNVGDTPEIIAQKMADACASVLGAPVTAVANDAVVTFTTKWKGATSAQTNIVVDYGANTAGVSYAQTTNTAGSGTVNLTESFAQIGDLWVTEIINSYGVTKLAEFEQFNGIPDPDAPTGRWSGIVFKPFISFFGSTLSDKDDLAAITHAPARVSQVTNVLCPAPNSTGFDFEAAANWVYLASIVGQNTPHLDINAKSFPDMPTPKNGDIGDMRDYNNRDYLVKRGCSTVILENGFYKVEDSITTYHPEGESPLQYAYTRNLNIDFNVKDGYTTLERLRLRDKVLIRDKQIVSVGNAIKPSEWKAVGFDYLDTLAEKALINDPDFSKNTFTVQISPTNPNRFETFFRYKRTGIARIQSTDVEAGF